MTWQETTDADIAESVARLLAHPKVTSRIDGYSVRSNGAEWWHLHWENTNTLEYGRMEYGRIVRTKSFDRYCLIVRNLLEMRRTKLRIVKKKRTA